MYVCIYVCVYVGMLYTCVSIMCCVCMCVIVYVCMCGDISIQGPNRCPGLPGDGALSETRGHLRQQLHRAMEA